MYTIGKVAEMFNLSISALRYYDKEGLFPELERSSGIRRFGERELEALRLIECLKRSGLRLRSKQARNPRTHLVLNSCRDCLAQQHLPGAVITERFELSEMKLCWHVHRDPRGQIPELSA